MMEGVYSTGSASVSVNTTDQGKAYAGSISVNRMVDTTNAAMDSVTVTQAGNIGLTAKNSAEVFSVGGGVAGTAGAKGVAGSIGYNQIAAATEAAVLGTNRRSSLAVSGDLDIDAEDDMELNAIGVSVGVTTGQDSTAVAFTVGINILANSQSVFSGATAGAVLGEISNTTITSVYNVSITATDNSVIQAIGGALGIGVNGSGYGVGLSWNQIVLNVDALIDNSSVTASGSVTLTSQSTENAGLLDGKISAAAVGAAGASGSTAVGASVSVNGTIDDIEANIQNGATVSGTSIALSASDTDTIKAVTGAAAISTKGNGIGAAIGANYIDNTVTASVNGSSATATAGDVTTTADEEATIQALAVGLEGAQNSAGGGSLSINVITDTVTASIAGAAVVSASGNVKVKSTNDATIAALAGQIAIGGKVGVGISITTSVVVDHTYAFISGTADVTGDTGVSINANSDQHLSTIAVGGTIGGSNVGVAGSATVTVIDETTLAYVDTPGSTRPATAIVQGGTGSGSTGNVAIDAEDTMELLGTAGALTFGGKAGVGVGVDAGVVTRKTQAYIGANAKVAADGSVTVVANASETITSLSLAGAFSGNVAVGVTAGVSTLDLTTSAFIDSGAVVTAKNNVLVSAEDGTTVTQVAGNINGSGSVAVGVGAGISVIDKTTDSYIASDAQVTALAQGSAITANTGRFGTPTGSNASTPADTVDFTTAGVLGDTITTSTPHGLNTGDEVVYSGANDPLGGLVDGGEYYVIKVNDTQYKLARSFADAQAGNAIALSAGDTSSTDQHEVQRISNVGVPSITTPGVSTNTLDLGNIANNLEGAPETALRSGLIVVSVSTNHIDSAGVAGGGSGTTAVEVAGSVMVHNINTTAHIDAGAKINQNNAGAGANQSVYVDAGRNYFGLGIGGTVAIAGTAGISPSLTVPVLEGTTSAIINGQSTNSDVTVVNAARDVEVAATANAEIIAVAAGIAVAGTAGIAGVGRGCLGRHHDGGRDHRLCGRRGDRQRAGDGLRRHHRLHDRGRHRHRLRRGRRRRRGGGRADQQEHQCAHRQQCHRRRRRQRRKRCLGRNRYRRPQHSAVDPRRRGASLFQRKPHQCRRERRRRPLRRHRRRHRRRGDELEHRRRHPQRRAGQRERHQQCQCTAVGGGRRAQRSYRGRGGGCARGWRRRHRRRGRYRGDPQQCRGVHSRWCRRPRGLDG